MAEQNVTLMPGESKLVSFEAIPHEAKVYQVTVNGLAGSFAATVAYAFSFGTPVVTLVTCQSASAWKVADVVCDVSNLNSVVVTRKISCWWAYESDPSKIRDRYWTTDANVWRSLTLNPGQTVRLVSPGNLSTEWSNSPLYGIPRRYFYYRLMDDLGNSSPTTLG